MRSFLLKQRDFLNREGELAESGAFLLPPISSNFSFFLLSGARSYDEKKRGKYSEQTGETLCIIQYVFEANDAL